MPRFDRTGPQGLGPMTGRGAGYCAGSQRPGYGNTIPGRTPVRYGDISPMYGGGPGSGPAGPWFGRNGGGRFGRGRRRNR
jgi:hypothetical protein